VIVSTPHRAHAQERFIFVDHSGTDVEVIRERDLGSVWNGLLYRSTGRMSNLYTIHSRPPLSRADLFHLYNACSVSRRPWVVTVENWPFGRFGPIDRAALVAGGHCKQVLAMSEWVLGVYREAFGSTEHGRRIVEKMTVLRPPQALVPRQPREDDGLIRMCFVGTSFFRKGGLELLRAFEAAHRRHPELRLELVTSFATDSYPEETSYGEGDIVDALAVIARNPETIVLHRSLPNPAVLDLFARSDVGFLPSLFDTYGFSVLEMQAASLPVVVTNQRALPEMVASDRGWVIELPLGENRTVDRSTAAARDRVSRELVDALVAVMEDILPVDAAVEEAEDTLPAAVTADARRIDDFPSAAPAA